ncbi:Dihydroanticapsin 7-dehydrogenase [Sinobacterium norvegicum]|uniref:Dihydroanticapsin 7-dehydrogenase n=1 Tax=Sinobacterium norvegicum TaxID=1641715 RepID=A0ABN8EQT2_9GAMM|nr:SDR family oxidoreductase [Sinobacterium norvegicum]CAH0993368.1 Dihydroanticapsin 7-dehydrogenase [Sinobacterium norvegicum]
MPSLANTTAIITGAGQGIGRGVARAFAAEGANIVIANRNEAKGNAVAEEINQQFSNTKAIFVATDVANESSVANLVNATVSAFGGIDVIVNNATPSEAISRLEKMNSASMQQNMAVNCMGPFWLMQKAFPYLKSSGKGRIINMASLNGINAHQYTAGYNSSKEALRALSRTAAVEWGKYGITCNIVCPAAITEPWLNFEKYDPKSAQALMDTKPMTRMGDAENDIGPICTFLASEPSRYITGNTIHADGGGHINGVPWKFELPE